MVDNVFVAMSAAVYVLLSELAEDEQTRIAEATQRAIYRYMENANLYPEDAASLSREIAELYPKTSVASHVIVNRVLNIFVDTLALPAESQFLYIPHSTRMH